MSNNKLEGRFIIKDMQTGEYSRHTTIEDIFDMSADNTISNSSDWNDRVVWKDEFKDYSLLDKKNFVETYYDYKFLKPTFDNIKAYEDAGYSFESEIKLGFGVSRALYTFGRLQGDGSIVADEMDMDDIEEVCIRLANDWDNQVDIANSEEQGYPQPYIERRLLENYGANLESKKNMSKINNRELER